MNGAPVTSTSPPRPLLLPLPTERGHLPPDLQHLLAAETLERWISRAGSAPRAQILAIRSPADGTSGVALLLQRPGTAQVKVADAVGDLRAVTSAVLAHAREIAAVAVKWEAWSTAPPDGFGFTPLRPPRAEQAVPPSGYVCWIAGPGARHEPEHYRQSEPFTCGAVAALLARAGISHSCGEGCGEGPGGGCGEGSGGGSGIDRAAELTLWRDATHVTACEPIGLGLAMRRRWPELVLRIHLDTAEPVMLEHLDGPERAWRALLQQEFRREAEQSGLLLESAPLSLEEIRRGVERGEQFLLLISLQEMLGVDVPHWVLCHGAVPGALLVEEPWVAAEAGESWVDSHLLPLEEDALERMTRIGPQGYRGAIRVTAAGHDASEGARP